MSETPHARHRVLTASCFAHPRIRRSGFSTFLVLRTSRVSASSGRNRTTSALSPAASRRVPLVAPRTSSQSISNSAVSLLLDDLPHLSPRHLPALRMLRPSSVSDELLDQFHAPTRQGPVRGQPRVSLNASDENDFFVRRFWPLIGRGAGARVGHRYPECLTAQSSAKSATSFHPSIAGSRCGPSNSTISVTVSDL